MIPSLNCSTSNDVSPWPMSRTPELDTCKFKISGRGHLQLQTYLVIISSLELHKEELVTNLIFEKRAWETADCQPQTHLVTNVFVHLQESSGYCRATSRHGWEFKDYLSEQEGDGFEIRPQKDCKHGAFCIRNLPCPKLSYGSH